MNLDYEFGVHVPSHGLSEEEQIKRAARATALGNPKDSVVMVLGQLGILEDTARWRADASGQ